MANFQLKRGDTVPALRRTLLNAIDDPVDLTNADVSFHMRQKGRDDAAVDAAATVVNASGGEVEYRWEDGDTDEAGVFLAEFEVTYADGSVETFPNTDNILIRINEDIA